MLGLADEAEDPREVLDLAFSRQVELLAKARRAVADVVTARKRLELQARGLRTTVDRLDLQARSALQLGRRDTAAEAVTWRGTLQNELAELERQLATLATEEARLRQVVSQLDLQLHQIRVRRDTLRASYAAARARAEVGKALAEAAVDHTDVLRALQEADERLARTRALADAMEGIAARGALQAASTGVTGSPEALRGDAAVSEELTRLEEEQLWGPAAGDRPDPGPRASHPEAPPS